MTSELEDAPQQPSESDRVNQTRRNTGKDKKNVSVCSERSNATVGKGMGAVPVRNVPRPIVEHF